MNRFLLNMRQTYTNKRFAFLISFAITILILYFAPYYIDAGSKLGFFGLFTNILEFKDALHYMRLGYFTMFDLLMVYIFPLVLFVLALIGIGLSIKFKPMFWLSAPFHICAIVMTAREINHIDIHGVHHIYKSDIYSIFYIIFVLIIICVMILLTVALYAPLKEPKPRTPRPHKPTDRERIAELERQVEELRKEKDAE